MYIYKSKPFDHQDQVFTKTRDLDFYALFMEQGTGKTKPTIDTAAYLFETGRIDLFVVIAPNGVHRKWLTEDIPLSLPDRIEYDCVVWKSDGTVRMQRDYDRLLNKDGDHLRIFLINVEFLSHKKGVELLEVLLRKFRTFMAVDESSTIMNITSKRTENIVGLGELAEFKRILNGTPVVKAPFDLYAQFLFLNPDVLGRSWVAFKAEYAEWYPPTHPFVANIAAKHNALIAKALQSARAAGWPDDKSIDLRSFLPPGAVHRMPQIIMTDAAGMPKYKHLDRLKAKIDPHSFRITKDECFDLPPKIPQTRFFAMTKEQRKIYDDLYSKHRAIIEAVVDGTPQQQLVIIDHKLTVMLRLHQVACGYLPVDGKEVPIFRDAEGKNPRVIAVMEDLKQYDGQTIIWCRFRREVRVLAHLLGQDAVTFFGDTTDAEENKTRFQRGEVKYLVGTAAFGGMGHNFANSSKAVFCSNTFSFLQRSQAEDRQHRYGLADHVDHVLYVDIQAEDSVDQDIIASLRNKQDLADYMMNKKPTVPGEFLL